FSTSALLETSVGSAITFVPYLFVNSLAIDINVSSLLATKATFIFLAANFSAIALPIPLLAPVTIAVFGCNVHTSFILDLILLLKIPLYSFLCMLIHH